MDFGRAIRICRAASGLRQIDLARKLTIGRSQLSLIEAGKRKPSLRVIEDIAIALRLPSHLILLLAADSADLQAESPDMITSLGQALLKLIIASQDDQKELPFQG